MVLGWWLVGGAGAVLAVRGIVNYFFSAASKPQLYYKSTEANEQLLAQVAPLQERYWPTAWLANGHLMTCWVVLNKRLRRVTYKREEVQVCAYKSHLRPGVVALDWVETGQQLLPTTPTLIILHGLTGGSHETYVKEMVHYATTQLKWRCVVMNQRGCGGNKLQTPQAYCGAYTDDFRQIVHYIANRLPQSQLCAVAFSLGANILTKYVGEEGENVRLHAAVAVAPPFNLTDCSRELHANWFTRQLYSRRLAASLVALFQQYQSLFTDDVGIDFAQVFKAQTIVEFDEALTRKSFGYPSVRAYYEDAVSARFIPRIACRYMALSALDDPICTSLCIPYEHFFANPNVILATTYTGGHSMEWYEGTFTTCPESWSCRTIASFFAAAIKEPPRVSPVVQLGISSPRTLAPDVSSSSTAAPVQEAKASSASLRSPHVALSAEAPAHTAVADSEPSDHTPQSNSPVDDSLPLPLPLPASSTGPLPPPSTEDEAESLVSERLAVCSESLEAVEEVLSKINESKRAHDSVLSGFRSVCEYGHQLTDQVNTSLSRVTLSCQALIDHAQALRMQLEQIDSKLRLVELPLGHR